jgi:hypothetical protein
MKQNFKSNTLHIFYRLSDRGENKERLFNSNNKNCLENFLREFPADSIEIVADHVEDLTMNWLAMYHFKNVHRTNLGNTGSFWFAYKLAMELPAVENVYFVENDYIHRPNSMKILREGLEIADYITLYDHPDKYQDGFNPQVKNGAEKSKIFLTKSSHWKITNSTTMTFASKVAVLKRDQFVFKLFTVGFIPKGFPLFKRWQERKIPSDYRIFSLLQKFKKRSLICSIPGYSTHAEKEFLTPLIDWEDVLITHSDDEK